MIANIVNKFYFNNYFGFLSFYFSAGFFAYLKYKLIVQMSNKNIILEY